MTSSRTGLLIGLLIYTVAMRCLPYILQNCDVKLDPTIVWYPWSFSPLTAVCLLSGACVTDRRWALALPLAALFLSNVLIGLLSGHMEWAFPGKMWWLPYVAFAGAAWLGTWLRERGRTSRLALAIGLGLAFEVAYFLVSNLSVWLLQTTLYPHTTAGLWDCYMAALPFFRWSPVSTAFFTLLVFGPLGAFATNEKPAPSNDLVPAPAR